MKGIDIMKNLELFSKEIGLLKDQKLRDFAKMYFDEYIVDYFWNIGASSSGKYHPQFSQGTGGLVKHTKAVVMFAQELLRMLPYSLMTDEEKDYAILACLVHDVCKYGMGSYCKEEYSNHARNAATSMRIAWRTYFGYEAPDNLLSAIRCHMGQWTERECEKPVTRLETCVHMADYMASRSFINIPSIEMEYWAKTMEAEKKEVNS